MTRDVSHGLMDDFATVKLSRTQVEAILSAMVREQVETVRITQQNGGTIELRAVEVVTLEKARPLRLTVRGPRKGGNG